jgi:DNA-binding CsgD family transcriptional regulator
VQTPPELAAKLAAQRHQEWLVEAARARLRPQPADAVLAELTRREREVLLLLVARYTDREIAAALCISQRTASTHVARILAKLGVGSRREAAALAFDLIGA